MVEEPISVLVIDDDVSIVEMIRLGLEADGMSVLGAQDGAEGIGIQGTVLEILGPKS